MKNLIQLIYISSSKVIFDDRQLSELLTISKRENTKRGVSGLLLHKDGSFIQVIEGEKSIIERLYSNIGNDERHTGIILLIKESISVRDFSNWSMAIHKVPISMSKDFSDFFTCPAEENMLPSKAKTLLLNFKSI